MDHLQRQMQRWDLRAIQNNKPQLIVNELKINCAISIANTSIRKAE